MLHGILNKCKLVGLFSDYQKCKVMFEGLILNNFVERKNLEIKSYYVNSITAGEYKEDSEYTNDTNDTSVVLEEFSDNNTTDSDVKPKKLNEEELKEKINIQNELHQLKKKKEKLEESKRVYEVDLDLYKKFKKIKETNSNFQIPDMFIDKFDLMDGLEKESKLCWENFYELYSPKKMTTNYDKLFN